jgi:hypothetical protein
MVGICFSMMPCNYLSLVFQDLLLLGVLQMFARTLEALLNHFLLFFFFIFYFLFFIDAMNSNMYCPIIDKLGNYHSKCKKMVE